MLTWFLYLLVVVISFLLIGIILIQPSKSGGMGAAFGGIGESVFGAQAGSHLTRATVVLTAVFFVVTLLLAAIIGHGWSKSGNRLSEIDNMVIAEEQAPANENVPQQEDASGK